MIQVYISLKTKYFLTRKKAATTNPRKNGDNGDDQVEDDMSKT